MKEQAKGWSFFRKGVVGDAERHYHRPSVVRTAHCCIQRGESVPYYLGASEGLPCPSGTEDAESSTCRDALKATAVCTSPDAYARFPECRRWCAREIGATPDSAASAACEEAARAFCAAHPHAPDCECLTKDPKACEDDGASPLCRATRELPKRCWWKACARPFSAHTRETLDVDDCPDRYDYCVREEQSTRAECEQAEVSDKVCEDILAYSFPCQGRRDARA